MLSQNEIIIDIDQDTLEYYHSDSRKQKFWDINWYASGKLPQNITGTRMFYLLKNTNKITGFTKIRNIKDYEKENKSKKMFSYIYDYYGPKLKKVLKIPENGFRIYFEEFEETYYQLKQKQPYDLEILGRCIDGVQNSYENAHLLHSRLPNSLKEKYSYEEILMLFNRLQWNCQILNLEIKKGTFGGPWLGGVEQKNVEVYRLHDKIRLNYPIQNNPEFLEGILEIVNNNWSYEKMRELLNKFGIQ